MFCIIFILRLRVEQKEHMVQIVTMEIEISNGQEPAVIFKQEIVGAKIMVEGINEVNNGEDVVEFFKQGKIGEYITVE